MQNFTLLSYSVNGLEIVLHLEWLPPLIINGELASYDICVSIRQLEADKTVLNGDGRHECATQNVSMIITVYINDKLTTDRIISYTLLYNDVSDSIHA